MYQLIFLSVASMLVGAQGCKGNSKYVENGQIKSDSRFGSVGSAATTFFECLRANQEPGICSPMLASNSVVVNGMENVQAALGTLMTEAKKVQNPQWNAPTGRTTGKGDEDLFEVTGVASDLQNIQRSIRISLVWQSGAAKIMGATLR